MAIEVKLEPVTAAFEGSRQWWLELAEGASRADLALPADPNDSFYLALFAVLSARILGFASESSHLFEDMHAGLEGYARDYVDSRWKAAAGIEVGAEELREVLPYLLEESRGVDNLFPLPAVIGTEVDQGVWDAREGWQLLVDTFEAMIARCGSKEGTRLSAIGLYLGDIIRVADGSWVGAENEMVLSGSALFHQIAD